MSTPPNRYRYRLSLERQFSDFDLTQVTVEVGEVSLIIDETDTETLGLSSGTQLAFDNGAVFEVTGPELIANRLPGDNDQDGTVEYSDYSIWDGSFGQSGPGLPADSNGNNRVDGIDFLKWQQNLGQADPMSTGVWVAGYLLSGTTVPNGSKATLVDPGYRVSANLEVTGALSGGNVSLRIDETSYTDFTIPAGTALEFSGGAKAIVDTDTTINNSSGTAVPVTLTADSEISTIGVGEGSSTSNFFTGVDFEVTAEEVDGMIELTITTAGITEFTIPNGTRLFFSGGAILDVFGDSVFVGGVAYVSVEAAPGSPLGRDEVMLGETVELRDLDIVSTTKLVLQDNDTAGITLTPSATTTTEGGGTQTIDVLLTSEPTENVIVYLGTDASEALLTDSDETDQPFIQLLFTPFNWDVVQQVTVSGQDDDEQDGNTQYAIRTTVVSNDVEYTDDTVAVTPVANLDLSSISSFFVLDEIIVPDTDIPDDTILTFTNGAKLNVVVVSGTEVVVKNKEPQSVLFFDVANIDTIGTNETATVHDGDMLTAIEVTSALTGGFLGLRIDSTETKVTSATLKKGKKLIFDNGTEAVLNADVTLNNSIGVIASVTLIEGSTITTSETSFFEENLLVTTAYDSSDGSIGLTVDDPLIGSITFAATTEFEFSNGALATIASQTVYSSSSETNTTLALNPTLMTSQGRSFFAERLVEDLLFTNTDDDVAGVTVSQTDSTIAVS